jgi:ABC-type Fe3+-hydroxamate transport system substrate-binding protein
MSEEKELITRISDQCGLSKDELGAVLHEITLAMQGVSIDGTTIYAQTQDVEIAGPIAGKSNESGVPNIEQMIKDIEQRVEDIEQRVEKLEEMASALF